MELMDEVEIEAQTVTEILEEYFQGLAGAVVVDPALTSLLIGSFCVAKTKGVAAGAAVFFLGHSAAANLDSLARSVRLLAPRPKVLPTRP